MSIVISLTAQDFEFLWCEASEHTTDLAGFHDRFHDPATGQFPADLARWGYAYWFEDYPHVILARSFLLAYGEPFLVTSDEYSTELTDAHGYAHHNHSPGWVIFTDYASPYFASRRPVSLVAADDSTTREQQQ
jgi:hypothetical protein